jgi:multimeric flavodoxin WrbA/nitrite reductase/ring-hydroxylating ferredoxin subunit
LRQKELQQINVGKHKFAVSYVDGEFNVISGICNHVGGPLGEGRIEDGYVVCPWHYWRFHHETGQAHPPIPAAVPTYATKIENGRLYASASESSKRVQAHHPAHPLARPVDRQPGPPRLLGISTTAMTKGEPRFSTSDSLLEHALAHAKSQGAETQLIRIEDLKFRECEGFYSKSAQACTWPCSITQMDPSDQMDKVYEGLVHWGDAFVVSTPIRWGTASSLYFKMAERLNCVQNQETIADRHLMKNKTAGFIITGGQDNVQAVAGQMLAFFGELGCQFPQFPYIAHTRGWSAEDMENNIKYVKQSKTLKKGAEALVDRILTLTELLLQNQVIADKVERGGRKAAQLDVKAQT